MSFGKILKDIRLDRGLTVEEMATLIDEKHASNYYRYENGRTVPDSKSKVIDLVRHLKLTKDELQELVMAAFEHHYNNLEDSFK